jgi:hypothetical protein
MTVLAVFFGGPKDGANYEIEMAVPIVKFPVRKTIIQLVQEGTPLNTLYDEITYMYVMHWNNAICLYIYENK